MDRTRATTDHFRPARSGLDTAGVHINAHGGGFHFENGTYYWFGQHKIAGRQAMSRMSGAGVYSSRDLYN